MVQGVEHNYSERERAVVRQASGEGEDEAGLVAVNRYVPVRVGDCELTKEVERAMWRCTASKL
jgi:hypothetical protein